MWWKNEKKSFGCNQSNPYKKTQGMASVSTAAFSGESWGEDVLSGAGSAPKGAQVPLPPSSEEVVLLSSTATSETSIKTHTSYRYTATGEVEKVTRRYRVVTLRTRVPPAVRQRRENLIKFGAAAVDSAEENAKLTKDSKEDVFLELPSAGEEREERATREARTAGVRKWRAAARASPFPRKSHPTRLLTHFPPPPHTPPSLTSSTPCRAWARAAFARARTGP